MRSKEAGHQPEVASSYVLAYEVADSQSETTPWTFRVGAICYLPSAIPCLPPSVLNRRPRALSCLSEHLTHAASIDHLLAPILTTLRTDYWKALASATPSGSASPPILHTPTSSVPAPSVAKYPATPVLSISGQSRPPSKSSLGRRLSENITPS